MTPLRLDPRALGMQVSRRGQVSRAGASAFSRGTRSAVPATARAARRVVPAREIAGPGPVSPPPPLHHIRRREAASVGGRRDLTLAPSHAAGRGGDGRRPGGSTGPGDGRRVVYTKCIRNDFGSSGRLRGVGFPPSGFLMASSRRLRSCHVDLLDHGWIQHSTAGHTANRSVGNYHDYWGLNTTTRPAVEPLARIDALLDGKRRVSLLHQA